MAPPRRSRRLALQHVSITDLKPRTLRHILLTATTHDNLLRFVATCARVCPEWWRVVRASEAYGRTLLARERVLKAIAEALEMEGDGLDLASKAIGDAGAAVLGVAAESWAKKVSFARVWGAFREPRGPITL